MDIQNPQNQLQTLTLKFNSEERISHFDCYETSLLGMFSPFFGVLSRSAASVSSRRLPLSAGSARGGARGSIGLVAREKGERGRRR